ncbi:MAG: hypothetical protein A2086_05875 [Spirochaetes bacterium GWD1_27_9]|nr:MAG: hypothetical protein A2Z98_17715 [Spirochaetes bacterium GWB1_27_13]OHD35528.1 MAG: hypothetical protein A2086_05875 [Spirochaetes bacterium GWD1_27_9]
MKIFFIVLSIFLLNFSIYTMKYSSEEYYYSIEIPKYWAMIDDSKGYNVFFRNDKKECFAEVTVLDLKSAANNEEVFKSFVKRYKMKGSYKITTFCRYKAIRGNYDFNFNGMDLKMDMVSFKDNYFFYVIMSYGSTSVYKNKKQELTDIIQSFKIYYDNNVVYGNDNEEGEAEAASADDSKEYDNAKNNKVTEDNTKKSGKSYNLRCNWDKYKKVFSFMEDDYYKAMDEMQEIVYPSIWSYFNIDTNSDSDYNFTFWKKFYQEVFNKNYYRVNDVVEWFQKESKDKKMNAYDLVTNVMKFIQVIPYERPNKIVKDTSKGANILDFFTPNETAYYNKGDCDTKSLFMVIILKRLGFDAVMYYSYDYSHAMVGINLNASGSYKTFENKKYYFIESTYPGWSIGDLPPEMNNTKKWRLIPIN